MRIMILSATMLLFSSQAFALTAEWNRNVEDDMKEYNMYLCEGKNCVVQKVPAMKAATIPQPAVNVTPTWPMPAGKTGAIAVTAIDTSGNESPLSNVVFFDQAPPTAPTGLVIK